MKSYWLMAFETLPYQSMQGRPSKTTQSAFHHIIHTSAISSGLSIADGSRWKAVGNRPASTWTEQKKQQAFAGEVYEVLLCDSSRGCTVGMAQMSPGVSETIKT